MAELGDRVIFYPRVPYGRQSQLAGLVTRVVGDGVIDLIAFPSGGEPLHMNGIRQRSENVQIYCWEEVGASEPREFMVSDRDSRNINLRVESLVEQMTMLAGQIEAALDRLTALEARRGPGRPPKVD